MVLSESGAPELNVIVHNLREVTLAFDVNVDGKQVAHSLGEGGSTGWLTESSGTHVVTENSISPGHYNATFPNGCDATGNVTLKPGDNQVCTIVNTPSTGCSAGQHCCGDVNSKVGCVAGCVSSAVACQPLCPLSTEKCCGKPLPNGKCETACLSGTQVCR